MRTWTTYYRPSQQPCTGNPCTQTSDDAQRIRVRDPASGRWSARVSVRTGCSTL